MNACQTCCLCFCTLIVLVFVSFSIGSLEPTEYGLTFTSLTGYVDTTNVYEGGRHFIGPFKSFIRFPATWIRLEYSDRAATSSAAPIDARTGNDKNDPDSGGQPIKLEVAFMYQINRNKVGDIYKHFSTTYEQRFLQYGRQTLSDVAAKYNPTQFWEERPKIAEDMLKSMQEALSYDGGVNVMSLQIIRCDFSPKYEDTITSIQLAVQSRTTNEYRQQVVHVLKNIDIAQTKADAEIEVTRVEAESYSRVLVNNASAQGYNMTQAAKSRAYARFVEALGFNHTELINYMRVKSVRNHKSERLVVGMTNPSTPNANPEPPVEGESQSFGQPIFQPPNWDYPRMPPSSHRVSPSSSSPSSSPAFSSPHPLVPSQDSLPPSGATHQDL